MHFWDTETCGFHGMPVLLQYAIDDGPSVLVELFNEKLDVVNDTIVDIVHSDSCLFNATFDIFHLYKFWTTAQVFIERYGHNNVVVADHIDEFALCEMAARDYPKTWRLKGVVDLMLVAQQTKYQAMMNRKDIRIRRVPRLLAERLVGELEERIKFSDIYFARRKNKFPIWRLGDVKDDFGDVIPDLVDIVCPFAPSKALKALAVEAGLVDVSEVMKFSDIEVPKEYRPVEAGFAPCAQTSYLDGPTPGPDDWRGTWPAVIKHHIHHWQHNDRARKYAELDPEYTRGIWEHLGRPQVNDTNSMLANMVAVCRWRGYNVDVERLRQMRVLAVKKKMSAPTAPRKVKDYIFPHLEEAQLAVIGDSTKRVILEEIAEWGGVAGEKAAEVLEARSAQKEVELFDKIIQAGRFHASFRVIGAKSDRMSGSDGLNAQGIKSTKEVRSSFPLAWDDMLLTGGDFDSFEVAIAEAVYGDPELRKALTEGMECPDCFGGGCSFCEGTGKIVAKLHALFAEALYPDKTYREIMESKGQEPDLYTNGKRGVFAQLYGGNENTLQERIGIPEDVALAAMQSFQDRFVGVKDFQDGIRSDYCSMTQPNGLGTPVVWKDPKEYVESMFGFKRFFDVENRVCKTLFALAEDPPKSWLSLKVKITRRDREQKIGNAVRSALFAAAFNIQGQNMRAAANHLIQSPGAHMTKDLQCRLWCVQPVGISTWAVQPLNVHDEIMNPCLNNVVVECANIVDDFIEEHKSLVPMLEMTWDKQLKSWAGKS